MIPSPLGVWSEYGRLRSVIMASPEYFAETAPINAVQEREFALGPPRTEDLVREQHSFADVVRDRGAEIHWLALDPRLPYQLNTRDVGAVIGTVAVACRMAREVRQPEVTYALDLLRGLDVPVVQVDQGSIEGGDIVMDGDVVYVGLGERTSRSGLDSLASRVGPSGMDIVPIRLAPGVLHLDTALTIASPGVALAYPPALAEGLPAGFAKRYDVIEVTQVEFERVGCNVFALGPQDVVVDANNPRIAEQLRTRAVEVTELDFSATTKIGGSFRCMTLPLVRDRVPGEGHA